MKKAISNRWTHQHLLIPFLILEIGKHYSASLEYTPYATHNLLWNIKHLSMFSFQTWARPAMP